MNKALHALVYVILAVAAVSLYFEYNLYGKKELLKDRNRQLEDYLINLSKTLEKDDAAKAATPLEAMKDRSEVEAKLVDSPEMENVLADYQSHLEEKDRDTLKWDDKERVQMRQLYALDGEGKKIPDVANPGDFVKKGPGTSYELLEKLFARAKAQQANLNTTRAELQKTRELVESLVKEYNALKPIGRQDKVTIEEKKAQIADLEQAKAAVEDKLKKTEKQVGDLESELKSAKDEIQTAKDETDAVKEELEKQEKLVHQLKEIIKRYENVKPTAGAQVQGGAVAALTQGNKGKLVEVNTKLMFVIVEFEEAAMVELLGEQRQNALPLLEMGVRRPGFNGPAGEYIGRIRLRQAVSGKNFVIADILGDWQQTELKNGDAVFAE